MIQKRLIVIGRVQDVDYRETVKTIARRMDILGEVRNLKDGTVEILCRCQDEGQLKNFKQLITFKDIDESKPNVKRIDEYPLEKLNLGFFTIDYGNLQEELLKKMNIGVKISKSTNTKIGSMDDGMKSMNTKMGHMNTEMKSMNTKMGSMDTEMKSMNTNMIDRFDTMEKKYDVIGKTVIKLERHIGRLIEEFIDKKKK